MIKDLYRYIWKVSGRQQIVLSLLAIAIFIIELVPLELQRRIVNDIVDRREYAAIGLLCLIYAGVVLVHGGLKLVLNVYGAAVGEGVNRRLRMGVAPEGPPAARAGVHTEEGIAISIIVAEADAIGGFIATSFSGPVLNTGILLSVLGYMLYTQPWLTPVVVLVFFTQMLFIPVLQSGINKYTTSRIKVMRALSVDVVNHAADRAPADEASRFRRQVGEVYRLSMQIFRRKYGMNFLMNLFYHLGVIGILTVGGWLVLQGKTEVGTIVAFISGLSRMNDPWGDLVNFFRDVTNTGVRFNMISAALPERAYSPAR